ncbi:MAG: ATP synthase F1 subunit gamma [Muribaculaceae bacterium]|nr:ATP synthase F1 subunit gamma [Muribaculaceae bacterium]
MATLRELKTRIGSVASSEKITGAMKMISSAKVHKYESELRQLLPFKNQIKRIMGHILATGENFNSPLTETRDVHTVGVVVYGSDDGLCGAYNINIFKHLLIELNHLREQYGDTVRFIIYPVGRKVTRAVSHIQQQGIEMRLADGVDSKMDATTVSNFTERLRKEFLEGSVDMVEVVYMRYVSMSRQIPTSDQIFPVDHKALSGEQLTDKAQANQLYIFEPDANSIFNEVLPMFVLSTMQEITIENRASEQAARVMAMQSANDNAKKLLESLRLEYNKLRQQSITTELLDILGGQVER